MLGGVEVIAELLDVEANVLGHRDQVVLVEVAAVRRQLVGVHRFLELPELVLGGGSAPATGCHVRLLAEVGEVAPLDAQRAVLDVLLHQGRFGVASELPAERALELRVGDHHDRRVGLAQRHRVAGVAAHQLLPRLRRRGRRGIDRSVRLVVTAALQEHKTEGESRDKGDDERDDGGLALCRHE